MDLTLQRLPGTQTFGRLLIEGRPFCDTLEDPVREQPGVAPAAWKIKGDTAIPVGRYRVRITMSPRFKKPLPHVCDVPGFEGIRIHGGRTEAHTQGCILVGQRLDNELHDSPRTMTKLMALLTSTPEPLWLTILPAVPHVTDILAT